MKYTIFVVLMFGTAFALLASGFALSTEIALIILVAAVGMDFFTTWRCLKKGRREGNPIIAFLFKKIGVLGTFILMACLWAAFIAFRWLPSSVGIQTAIALTYWLIPINNSILLVSIARKKTA